mmetsp:Transcript_138362/g.442144  ORF Transcript_138362/g.442144 Transcript_138362/m.442144 type:complete len:391 (+) Transcript_138362:80-1252(+)
MASIGEVFAAIAGSRACASEQKFLRRSAVELSLQPACPVGGGVLDQFEVLMASAASALGQPSLGIGALRHALHCRGRVDLAKDVSQLHQARRWAAHPRPALASEVRQALLEAAPALVARAGSWHVFNLNGAAVVAAMDLEAGLADVSADSVVAGGGDTAAAGWVDFSKHGDFGCPGAAVDSGWGWVPPFPAWGTADTKEASGADDSDVSDVAVGMDSVGSGWVDAPKHGETDRSWAPGWVDFSQLGEKDCSWAAGASGFIAKEASEADGSGYSDDLSVADEEEAENALEDDDDRQDLAMNERHAAFIAELSSLLPGGENGSEKGAFAMMVSHFRDEMVRAEAHGTTEQVQYFKDWLNVVVRAARGGDRSPRAVLSAMLDDEGAALAASPG